MLTITVITYKDTPVGQTIRAEFREEGGTIGRSPESTLILPDPDRIISRTHAIIAHAGGRFTLRDQGSTVPVIVNGAAVGKGHDRLLTSGDELRIAGYVLLVEGPGQAIAADDTTTILREGTMLSWSEDGAPVSANRISSVIVPAPIAVAPAPQAPAAAGPATAPVAPAMPAPADTPPMSAADRELLMALLRGAGVPELDVPGGLTPRFMEDLGAVMRETMRGLLDLLAARANAKREVRADATVIVASDNNPLKFAPGVDVAVAHLLQPPAPGFMSAQRSLADARESLRSHQEGFVAGMRAALEAVLSRFNPAQLETRLKETSSASFMPMNQKARLWSQYESLYADISREAETDFHFLFGKEFLAAYQARTRATPQNPDGP